MTMMQVAPLGKISERAMLVQLKITGFTNYRQSTTGRRELAQANGASEDMVRAGNLLIPKEALEEVNQAERAARREFRSRTLTWLDDGTRILGAAQYMDFMKTERDCEAVWQKAVDGFKLVYPATYIRAQQELGSMFNPAQYPDPNRVGERFTFGTIFLPWPDVEDMRVDIGAAELERVTQSTRAQMEQVLQSTLLEAAQRIADVVGHMVEALKAYDLNDGKRHSFYDSTVENVRGLVNLLPSFNITANAELDVLTQQMRDTLCVWDAAELKQSPRARELVAAAAEAIVEQVSEFLQG